jgi:pimeloyl-ACP methyl ester carboxylesterase
MTVLDFIHPVAEPGDPFCRRSSMSHVFIPGLVRQVQSILTVSMVAAVSALSPQSAPAAGIGKPRPTVVLVHGAFADSASWNGVTTSLLSQGFPVVAVANPLRSLKGDAAYVDGVVSAIAGDVVLVGHSYGGAVITNIANARSNVKALVYVAAFAPDSGESALQLSGRFPGSTLGDALSAPVALTDGGKDLYIQQGKFHQQFAADMPERDARLMAAGQRPITEAALSEGSGIPAWKAIPAWFIHGDADKNIPPAAMNFMAHRAGSRRTEEVRGASHVVMSSHPAEVAQMIVEAATAVSMLAKH